jgi:hypothetical protein
MTSFFVSPFKPPGEWYGKAEFKIESAEFVAGLRSRWSNIEIEIEPGPGRFLLRWEVLKEDGRHGIRGSLFADYPIVVLDGSTEDIAEFVLWYRSVVPDKHRLFFFHESLYTCMEIKSGTHLKEIITGIEEGIK